MGQNFLRNSQICERLHQIRHAKFCRSTRRASTTNKHECGCSQVKGKSKTTSESIRWDNRNHADASKRRWIDTEPSKQNFGSYDLSKKVFNLLRHNQKLQRDQRQKQKHKREYQAIRRKTMEQFKSGEDLEYFFTFTTLDAFLSFILLLTTDWYLEVKSWAKDWQYSFCPPIWETRFMKISWIFWFLCTTSSAIRPHYMEETPIRGVLGWYWFCDQRRIIIVTNTIECNCSSREHFQFIVFQKLWAWRLEKFYMKDDTCLFDDHQRSHYDTITIGLKEMMNWVPQLMNNSRLENSFNSVLEKHHVKLSIPTQSKPNPICDRSGKHEFTERGFADEMKDVPFTRRDQWETFAQRTWLFRKNKETCEVWRHSRQACSRWNRGTCLIKRKHTQSERTICSCRTSWHCSI